MSENASGADNQQERPLVLTNGILRDYTPSPHFFKKERGEDIVQSFWRQKVGIRMNSDRVKVA